MNWYELILYRHEHGSLSVYTRPKIKELLKRKYTAWVGTREISSNPLVPEKRSGRRVEKTEHIPILQEELKRRKDRDKLILYITAILTFIITMGKLFV